MVSKKILCIIGMIISLLILGGWTFSFFLLFFFEMLHTKLMNAFIISTVIYDIICIGVGTFYVKIPFEKWFSDSESEFITPKDMCMIYGCALIGCAGVVIFISYWAQGAALGIRTFTTIQEYTVNSLLFMFINACIAFASYRLYKVITYNSDNH